MDVRRRAIRVAAAVLLVYLLSPNAIVTDSIRVVPVAQSMLARRTISLDADGPRISQPGYGLTIRGGHIYPLFPWTVSLFVLPETAVVDVAHAVGIGPGAAFYKGGNAGDWFIEVVSMSIVLAAAVALLYGAAYEILGATERRHRIALAAALVFAFGTSAWSIDSRAAWQHGPSVLLLSAALWMAVRARTRPLPAAWFGAALAGAYAVRPTNAVWVLVLGVWVLLTHRRDVLRVIAGGVTVVVPFVAVNLAAYHALLPPYFLGNTATGQVQFLTALAGNVVSPARGLLVFSPVLVLAPVGIALRRRQGRADGLDLALAVGVVLQWLVVSAFPVWWGGAGYGPRFFADAVPALVILSVPAIEALMTAPRSRVWALGMALACVAALWSVAVNAEGAVLESSLCWNIQPSAAGLRSRVWSWSDAQVVSGYRSVLDHGLAGQVVGGGNGACPAP